MYSIPISFKIKMLFVISHIIKDTDPMMSRNVSQSPGSSQSRKTREKASAFHAEEQIV